MRVFMLRGKLVAISLILVLVGLTLWGCGTDSFSGTHLVFQADFSNIPADEQQDRLEETKEIIENRVIAYGVDEPVIQIEGTGRISVQLPGLEGIEDIEDVIELIGTTAELDFREIAINIGDYTTLVAAASVGDTTLVVADASKFEAGDSIRLEKPYPNNPYQIITDDGLIESIDAENNTITITPALENSWEASHHVQKWIPATGIINGEPIQLTGQHFMSESRAMQQPYPGGVGRDVVVQFEMKGEGVTLLEQITTRLYAKRLGVFLDNELISAPTVQEVLDQGEGIISGLERDEAMMLAIQLNNGALPVKLELISQEVVLPV